MKEFAVMCTKIKKHAHTASTVRTCDFTNVQSRHLDEVMIAHSYP